MRRSVQSMSSPSRSGSVFERSTRFGWSRFSRPVALIVVSSGPKRRLNAICVASVSRCSWKTSTEYSWNASKIWRNVAASSGSPRSTPSTRAPKQGWIGAIVTRLAVCAMALCPLGEDRRGSTPEARGRRAGGTGGCARYPLRVSVGRPPGVVFTNPEAREEPMGAASRREWLTAAAGVAGTVAMAGRAVAQTRPSPDEFVRAVKGARLFDLSFTWNEQSPILGLNPPYAFALNRTHRMTHEIFGQAPGSRVSWASEIMYFSVQHGSPTIDAVGHIGRDLKLHGGVDAVAATATPGGIGSGLGIDSFPADLLAPGFEITAAHLEQTSQAQGVTVQRGDSLLIRTGWGQYFATDNAKYLGEQSPGPGQDGARWIIAKGVRLAGDDTATFEKRPAAYGKELFSVHMMLLADSGIYIVENANLEALGDAKAYVVLLILTPLRIQGASGSPLRAIALTP